MGVARQPEADKIIIQNIKIFVIALLGKIGIENGYQDIGGFVDFWMDVLNESFI